MNLTEVFVAKPLLVFLFAALFPLAAQGAGKSGRPFRPATPDMPYVIITTRKLAPAFGPLAAWKTRTGLSAAVVTVEDIGADPANEGNDLPEKIRSFLRRAHENWNLRWVLLGGHLTEVPSRGTYEKHGKHASNGCCSDLYFGDVLPAEVTADTDVEIYNWNADGDGRFGESRDGMDLLPEMYVARLPVKTPAHVKDYLKKYFDYVNGKNGECLGRALIVGAEEFRRRQEGLTEKMKAWASKAPYTVDLLVEVPVPTIVETMNKGYGILDIFGHGCPHHMWLGAKRAHFGVTQIRTLTNKGRYGVVYSQGCSANDYRKWESIGIAFLLHPTGGAVAYTGYTATSFAAPVNEVFYRHIFEGTHPQLGRAMAEAKNSWRGAWVREYLNILGEPEMWVWTKSPGTLTVEGSIVTGRPVKLRIVDTEGAPVTRGRLTLRSGRQRLVGTSDAQGWVHLSALEKAGKARVFVIAQNYMIYDSSLSAAKAQGPVLRAPEFVVDDDREGESRGNSRKNLSPDETVELRLKWPVLPEKGTLRLMISDCFVDVLRDTIDAASPDASFLFRIKGSVRPGHRVWAAVKLTVPGVEGAWRWRTSLPVQGPSLLCVRCRIADRDASGDGRVGFEDAGGTVGMYLTLFNRGNETASGCTLHLSCEDPAVQIKMTEMPLGSLDPQESMEGRKPFAFALLKDYDGHPLVFLLTIKDRNGGLWKATLRICTPPAPPILLSHRPGTNYVQLWWRPGGTPGVHGYNVYRATRSGGPYKRMSEKPVRGMTAYRDRKVKPNDDYYYVLTSVTAEGLESPPSSEHHARTLSRLWGRKP
jgi:hypothetical protein